LSYVYSFVALFTIHVGYARAYYVGLLSLPLAKRDGNVFGGIRVSVCLYVCMYVCIVLYCM